MALVKRVTRVGNSAGLTIDQAVMKQLGWEIGTEVELTPHGEQLILTPHRVAKDDEARAAGERVVQTRRKLLENLAAERLTKR
ncbi:MAG TPA: AbrB/MazE/SpoVT family DNA-binding domain-containing protein [Vicinamibacterales bacterium]|jgi:antitoxin component of MazEF toxin-antitoxin module|nr:AbrB/MazE/SpoVT family DNA-binding domain-containing protein [Vicinamibacterales bacterium]